MYNTQDTNAPDRSNFFDFQIEPTSRTTHGAPNGAPTGALPMESPLRGVDPMDRPVGPHDDGAAGQR